MTNNEIKILFLEDMPTDVELNLNEIRKAGFIVESKVVQTGADFISALGHFAPDLILADYSLPSYSGMEALDYVMSNGIKIPFIFVSGSMGEEVAIEAVKHGATDYVLKTNLIRLVSSVKRALEESGEKKKREEAELALRRSEENFRSIFQTAASMIISINKSGIVLDCNTESEEILGYRPDSMIGYPIAGYIHPESRDKAMASIRHVFVTGYTFKNEFRMIAKDGSVKDVSMNSSLLNDKDEDKQRTICIIDNITERKRAEEGLVASEIRYRRLFESAKDGILILDSATGKIVDVNPFMLKLLGFSHEQFLGKSIWDIGFPSDSVVNKANFLELQEKEYIRYEDIPLETENGRKIDVEFVSNVYTVNNKKVIQCNIRDITERKRAERLAESQYNLINAVINSPSGIIIFSLDTHYCYTTFNKKHKDEMKRIWNVDIATGMNMLECLPVPEARATAKSSIDRALRGEIVLELQQFPNREIYYEFNWNPIYENTSVIGVIAFIRDVTDQKLAEKELQFKNLILSTQREASIDGILVVDEKGGIISSNRRFAEIWEIPQDIMDSESDERVLKSVADKLADPDKFFDKVKYLYEAWNETSRDEIVLKDGRTLDRYSAPMIDKDGKYFGRVWYFRDITERKRAEESLRLSEEKFSKAFQTAPYAITITRVEDGKFVEVNDAFVAVTEYTKEEIFAGLPRTLKMWVNEENQRRVVSDILAGKAVVGQEYQFRTKSGKIITALFSALAIRLDYGYCILSSMNDITERKQAEEAHRKLEEQLRVSQKMEAIGSLAGGIAHDFNNLLTAILAFTGFAIDAVAEGDRIRDDLLEVKKAGERAAVLTHQLLAFSRNQILEVRQLDLNTVVTEIEKMLRRIIGEDIDLDKVLAPNLFSTLADPGQIEQVLMNLAVNARDAMPDGGKLTIETSNMAIDEERARQVTGIHPGDYVSLVVSDTGCGMNAETLSRIFEPFFTTKAMGKGTGLGLSTVYGIVKQSGGAISVYSEPGRGTTFKVYLPRATPSEETASIAEPVRTRQVGTETILVVEDDVAIRTLVHRLLGSTGYTLLMAANSDEALGICKKHKGKIQLLLTDIVMPGMGGQTLADQITSLRPGIKILYMSGYADNAIVRHGVLLPGIHFIGKPFALEDFIQKVREVLDS